MNTNITNEDQFQKLEGTLTEIRKSSLGTLLLAKEIWRDKLKQKQEGSEVLKAIEEAEEAFVDNSLTDRFERWENVLDVINKRVRGLFLLLEDILKDQQKAE